MFRNGTGGVSGDPLIVWNPRAGGGRDHEEIVTDLAAALGAEMFRTSGPGDATGRVAEAGAGRLVVAAGGDGTLHEVVQGLAPGPEPEAVGVLPLGTANDFARGVGVPADPEEAKGVILDGRVRRMDLLRVRVDGQEAWAVNACTGGFSGAVSEEVEADLKRRWGPFSYLRSAVSVAREVEPWRLDLRIDGYEQVSLEALNVAVSNGPRAGGVEIAPEADPGDGRLDLLVVPAVPIPRLLAELPAALRGEPGPSLLRRRAARVELRTEPAMPFSLDGEPRSGTRLDVSVRAAALPVLVPAGPGEAR